MQFTRIKVISGHLTALDKRAILQILNAGETFGQTKNKTWTIEGNTVWTTEPVIEWSGKRIATYRAEFIAT